MNDKINISKPLDDNFYGRYTMIPGAMLVDGFFGEFYFEAKAANKPSNEGLYNGRVVKLKVFDSFIHGDDIIKDKIAYYDKDWELEPQLESVKAVVKMLTDKSEQVPRSSK